MSTGKSCILCPRKRCSRCFSSSFLLPSLVCPSWDKAFTLDELSEQSAFSPGQDKHPSLPDKFSQVTEAQTLLTFYSCQRDVIWTRETSLEASQASPGPSPISEVISELICSSPAALGPARFPQTGQQEQPLGCSISPVSFDGAASSSGSAVPSNCFPLHGKRTGS